MGLHAQWFLNEFLDQAAQYQWVDLVSVECEVGQLEDNVEVHLGIDKEKDEKCQILRVHWVESEVVF